MLVSAVCKQTPEPLLCELVPRSGTVGRSVTGVSQDGLPVGAASKTEMGGGSQKPGVMF